MTRQEESKNASIQEEEKAPNSLWQVYIILTESGKLYTGIAKNIERRLAEHQSPKGRGARFFSFSPPKQILFCEAHPNRSAASKREAAIKKMDRLQKLALIAKTPYLPRAPF